MFVYGAGFGVGEFAVEVSIELFGPAVARHDLGTLISFAAVLVRSPVKPGGRATSATSRCPWGWQELQRFPGTTFLQIHTGAAPRGRVQPTGSRPAVRAPDRNAGAG